MPLQEQTPQEQPPITEEPKKLILLVILLVAAVLAGIFSYINNKKPVPTQAQPQTNQTDKESKTARGPEIPTLITKGTVLEIDATNNEITVTLAASPNAFGQEENKETKVKITKDTVIQKRFAVKNMEGKSAEPTVLQINIADLSKGDNVTIGYKAEKDGAFQNVDFIYFNVVTDNLENSLKAESEKIQKNSTAYIRGKVAKVDTATATVEYYPYVFDQVNKEVSSATLREGAKAYAITDASQVQIIHSQIEIPLSQIKVEDIILVAVANDQNLSQKKLTAEAILLVSGK